MRAMDDASILHRLTELGYELPPPPQALAAYVPVVQSGDLAFVSGQVAMIDGQVVSPGRLGAGVTVEEAQHAARRAAVQALAALRGHLGSLDRLAAIVQLTVYVSSTAQFEQHPQVANGASELLVDACGEAAQHARAAIGVAALPLGASVEVALTARVDDRQRG
jgi:enamine deaminase RidA (YjgF/YER057c/UK114 family)